MLARNAAVLPEPARGIAGALVVVAACGALGCGAEPAGEALETPGDTSPYHILVTNDDGIESPGIQDLAAALREVGEVTVVAPCGERSGSSMSILLGQEVRLRTFPDGHCVDATPAGAVLFAADALAPESGFDVVVSGINRGANVGEVSHMSGTVGGAMMGAYLGMPAVAASLGNPSGGFGYAARTVARFAAELRRRGVEAGVVYSINFPVGTAEDASGIAARAMGGQYIKVEYEEVTGDSTEEGSADEGVRVFRPRFERPDPYPAGSDSEAYGEGFITITPLRFDWTDRPTVDALEGWDLEALLEDGEDGR
ncbi:MAG: 5'/3'-nucleotidase SurE [Gemmatimonadota bacterium]|nr:5'/3'-nucleotidase SurE [Gemmatimonadota bacterium]